MQREVLTDLLKGLLSDPGGGRTHGRPGGQRSGHEDEWRYRWNNRHRRAGTPASESSERGVPAAFDERYLDHLGGDAGEFPPEGFL